MHSIGEAARETGVAIETIRYYEREGIIPAPRRAANGRRLYAQSDLTVLHFVRRCRELGFPIADIRNLLRLHHGEGGQCDQARAIAEHNLASVRRKIADLRCMEQALTRLVADCRRADIGCPILDSLFD